MLYAGSIFVISPGFFVRHKTVVPMLNNLSIFKAENVIEGNMLAGSCTVVFHLVCPESVPR